MNFVVTAADAIRWTDIGMFAATVALAIVTGGLFWATRGMVAETRTLARKTAEMAKETAALATDTVDASDRADEHHQQTLWPFVVMRRVEEIDGTSARVELQNVGHGLALDVHVLCTSIDGTKVAPDAFTHIGAMEVGRCDFYDIKFFNANDPRSKNFLPNPPGTVEVYIQFMTMFGTHGYTRWVWYGPPINDFKQGGMELPEIRKRAEKAAKNSTTPETV